MRHGTTEVLVRASPCPSDFVARLIVWRALATRRRLVGDSVMSFHDAECLGGQPFKIACPKTLPKDARIAVTVDAEGASASGTIERSGL